MANLNRLIFAFLLSALAGTSFAAVGKVPVYKIYSNYFQDSPEGQDPGALCSSVFAAFKNTRPADFG